MDGKKKDIADQNQATSAIKLQVKSVYLETYKFTRLDFGMGIVYLTVERLKRGKKIKKSVRERLKTRPNSFF